jgi:hypothetical protein
VPIGDIALPQSQEEEYSTFRSAVRIALHLAGGLT